MSVGRYEWVDSAVTMGWRLLVDGEVFGRVVLRQGEYQAQKIERYPSRVRTLMGAKDPDEAFDYLLSLARLTR